MELEESTCLTSDYSTKLHSSRQYVLAQRQKYRSMQQNRKPRDKSRHLWTPLTKKAKIYNGEKMISLTSGTGKTGQPLVNNETRTLSNSVHKNKLKMD